MSITLEQLSKPDIFRQECIVVRSVKLFVNLRKLAEHSDLIKNIMISRFEDSKSDKNRIFLPYYFEIGSLDSWLILINYFENKPYAEVTNLTDIMILCKFLFINGGLRGKVFKEYVDKHFTLESIMTDEFYNLAKYIENVYIKNYFLDKFLLKNVTFDGQSHQCYTVDAQYEVYEDLFITASKFGIDKEELLEPMRKKEKDDIDWWNTHD